MEKDKQVIYKLKCISVISMLFMSIQIIGGIMANSIAILADAFHLLSDVLAYVISLQAVLMSYKTTPLFMTFGYVKVQPLGALINIAIIWFVTIELAIEATERIVNKSMVEDPLYMLLTSFFGLGCNLYIMKVLHSDTEHGGHTGCSHSHGEHGHDHNHSHQHTHNHNGNKCNHDHSNEKSIKQVKNKAQSNKSKENKCNHDHNHSQQSNNHSHDHDHHEENHEINENIYKNGHDHKHQHNHNHKNHKHEHHQHQHQHNHNDHHDHDHCHQHQEVNQNCNHNHEEENRKNQLFESQQLFVCDLNNNHTQDLKKCNSKGYEKLCQKYSVQQQITLQAHQNNIKLDNHELNLSDQDIKISQKQRTRKQFFNNINIQAAYIHIISDIILSIGVIISAVIIYFGADPVQWTYWQLFDPFCTYLFSIMAIYTTIGIAKDSIIILLDGCDDKQLVKQITLQLDNIQGISSYKDFRIWSLNRSKYCAAIKIYLNQQQYFNINIRDHYLQKVNKLFSNRKIQHYVSILENKNQNILKIL